jgi:pyruvate/2-oxoglutarate/acetoin dehydrogenase E1 component
MLEIAFHRTSIFVGNLWFGKVDVHAIHLSLKKTSCMVVVSATSTASCPTNSLSRFQLETMVEDLDSKENAFKLSQPHLN